MTQFLFTLALVPLLFTQVFAAPTPTHRIILIPGSGSSADRIYIDNLEEWGISKFLKSLRYFGVLEDLLIKNENLNVSVCPRESDQDTRALSEREEDCAREILKREVACPRSRSGSIHLVGHSMGGLVARLLAQNPKVKNCIASVTTISTPHQGTPFADFFMDRLKLDQTSIDLYARLARATRFTPERKRYIPELRVDRRGLAPSIFRAQDTPDNNRVKYFYISASLDHASFHPLQLSKMILARELRKRGLDQGRFKDNNDGVVPEYSMAHGQFLGRVASDHWSSACLDPLTRSSGCTDLISILVPHLKALCRSQ